MRRRLLVVSTLLAALAFAPAATANKPIREIIPAPDDMVISGQCEFPVFGHIQGSEIDTTFINKAGDAVKLLAVFPGNTLTLTSLDDTDKSLTLGATGSFQLRAKPDGTLSGMVTGRGVWLGNPVTSEPGIWYQNGRVSANLDAAGNTTSVRSTGTLVNVCPLLAS